MTTLQAEATPKKEAARAGAVSAATMAEHRKLYESYIRKGRELSDKLAHMQSAQRPTVAHAVANLKSDLTFVLSAAQNHDIYFPILGTETSQPAGALAEAINGSFHTLDCYLADLKHTAMASRGWTWTVVCLETGRLWNLPGAQAGHVPMWKVLPILAIDLYEHAYFSDYGSKRAAYIDAVIKYLNWRPAEALYHKACRLRQTLASKAE